MIMNIYEQFAITCDLQRSIFTLSSQRACRTKYNDLLKIVPVCATTLGISACVPCQNTYDEPLVGVQV